MIRIHLLVPTGKSMSELPREQFFNCQHLFNLIATCTSYHRFYLWSVQVQPEVPTSAMLLHLELPEYLQRLDQPIETCMEAKMSDHHTYKQLNYQHVGEENRHQDYEHYPEDVRNW